MLRLLENPLPTGGSLDDARSNLRSMLSTSVESDQYRDQILGFIDGHDDALFRTCLAGHLTGSALVVDDDRERTLVMLHAKLGMWLQPGGHADGEGHLATVAWTEATEETGIEGLRVLGPAIDSDVHGIPERKGEPEHMHLDTRFVVLAPPRAVVRGNHESHGLRWVTLDELDGLATDASLRRLARVGLDCARQADW
jgi:8-oxo-dGTP pyrophosphatase MutT (NUDIX family)